MGVRTGDIGLMLTRNVAGTPAAGEWTLVNGETITFPFGMPGDRIGVYTTAPSSVAILPGSMQGILWGESQASEGGNETLIIPAHVWAEWTYSEPIGGWVPTSASHESGSVTKLPRDPNVTDTLTVNAWSTPTVETYSYVYLPIKRRDGLDVELGDVVGLNVPLFVDLKVMVAPSGYNYQALAHDWRTVMDEVSAYKIYSQGYYQWIWLNDGSSNPSWYPHFAAPSMTASQRRMVGSSADFTAEGECVYIVDTSGGVVTVTLPPTNNVTVVVKRVGPNNVVISGDGRLIEGSATLLLSADHESVELVAVGDWYRI